MTSSQAKQIAEQYLSWLVGTPSPHQVEKLEGMIEGALEGQWLTIEQYDLKHCSAVLVTAKNRYGAWREPVSAYNDATDVWRVLGSKGGMTILGFTPTRFRPLPPNPKD